MKQFFSFLATSIFLLGISLSPARAESDIVLTISGNITSAASLDFTIEDLEALGIARIETETPWHDGKNVFEGVPLASLMAHAGAKGTTALVMALNNYAAEVPVADFTSHPVILAYKMNGKYMSVADKGPLFVIYPFSDYPDLQNEQSYARSVWQVRSITIE